MRNVINVIAGILSLSFTANAQSTIAPYHVAIGYNKTSNIIFPYAIKSVDRGSTLVLAQKAIGVENILQIKANEQGFAETNLSVITSDGKFYSFLVDYVAEPPTLNISFVPDSTQAVISGKTVNEGVFNNIATAVKNSRPFLQQHTYEQKMLLWLQGIYLTHDAMCFRFRLRNNSRVAYTPDYIRFFVRDKKRSKRTAVQETEITPLYATENKAIDGLQSNTVVFAFAPFTIPITQELVVQVSEKNGGRALVLHVSHRQLLKARTLN